MTQEAEKPLINIEGMEKAEDSFLDDEEDDPAISQNLYSFYSFPDEEPTSVRFKGKKAVFIKSVETLKDLLKKGKGSNVNNVSFNVLDVRMMAHGIEYDIQSSKNKDKGVSVLKIYGPKNKKGCTVMICKSREYENKFVSILAIDIIKHLLDNFETTDGWKNTLEFFTVKKPACQMCKKSFCNEKNLQTHMKKYHTTGTVKNVKCEVCDITYETENQLKDHNENKHSKDKIIKCEVCDYISSDENELKLHVEKIHSNVKHIKCEICNITLENLDNLDSHMKDHNKNPDVEMHEVEEGGVQKMEVDDNGRNENSENGDYKVKILEEKIKTMKEEYEIKMKELIKQLEEKEILYQANKKRMEKEDNRKGNEINKLKEENVKMAEELGKIQWNKDKMDAEIKAKQKMAKIKENTILFNEIIANDGMKRKNETFDNKNENEVVMNMEECDGGFRDEVIDVQRLHQNKQNGFKRTTPQESAELIRRIEKCEKQIIYCPQCDFVTPSEMFFNEHMTRIHTGPNCPFCFLPFSNYSELRKHCLEAHDENKQGNTRIYNNVNMSGNWKAKKPCRYFKNGEGNCSPRNGTVCEFDHSIIPFSERQECFHKQACRYKPYCIFYHPEGQKTENWQTNKKKVSKVCHNYQQGLACTRSECTFYHPVVRNYQDFQWDQLKKPPKMTRVPVIVKNNHSLNNPSQSLRGWDLD